MKRKLAAGLTSVTLPIFVQDTSSSTGAGLSLAHNASGLVAEYRRQGQSSWTAITLASGTLGTWSSGGWVADGALTGAYEVGLPDAVCATGARWAAVRFRGAANMLPVLVEIELDAVNYQDAVRFGLTALPNVAAGANGGLPTGNASGQVAVASLAANAITAAAIATDAIDADALAADAGTEIGAAVLTALDAANYGGATRGEILLQLAAILLGAATKDVQGSNEVHTYERPDGAGTDRVETYTAGSGGDFTRTLQEAA